MNPQQYIESLKKLVVDGFFLPQYMFSLYASTSPLLNSHRNYFLTISFKVISSLTGQLLEKNRKEINILLLQKLFHNI